MISRRSVLGLAAAAGLMPLASERAFAGDTVLSGVQVDASPLAARGLPNYARRIEELATPWAREIFGPQIQPGAKGAPRLILRISFLSLVSDPSPSRDRFFPNAGNMALDQIEGDGLLVGPKGQIIASKHIYTTNDARMYASPLVIEGENRRIARISEIFMRWIKTEMNI